MEQEHDGKLSFLDTLHLSKSEIKKRCSQSKEGKTLISKLSVTQIMNCIKYERRKVRSAK
jgi:hypothetical protein